MFKGFKTLDDPAGTTFLITFQVRSPSAAPIDSDALPTARVYGPNGFVPGSSVTAMALEVGTITGASNASPIVITSAGHGLVSGQRITVSGVLGNSAANGSWAITVIDADTFSLNSSSGNGPYTSGGVRHTSGLYTLSLTVASAQNYGWGTYTAIANASIGGSAWSEEFDFIVV